MCALPLGENKNSGRGASNPLHPASPPQDSWFSKRLAATQLNQPVLPLMSPQWSSAVVVPAVASTFPAGPRPTAPPGFSGAVSEEKGSSPGGSGASPDSLPQFILLAQVPPNSTSACLVNAPARFLPPQTETIPAIQGPLLPQQSLQHLQRGLPSSSKLKLLPSPEGAPKPVAEVPVKTETGPYPVAAVVPL